jgi:single-strand DNA-binding protein
LTKDPEIRYVSESETAVATFTLAIDRPGKDKGADFPRVTAFGKTAENCQRFLSKGKLAGVQGRIQTGSYKNKEGATVYTTEITAERVEFLSPRGESGGEPKQEQGIPEGFMALEDDDPDGVPF